MDFTWWGGFLGPKLLQHVRCAGCGTEYSGKTGKPNRVAIALYSAAGASVAALLFWAILSHAH